MQISSFSFKVKFVILKEKYMRYVVIVSYRVFPTQRETFFNLVRKEADALVQNEL